MEFKFLFLPLKIGPVTVRNRLLVTAHTPCLCMGRTMPTERLAFYHAERAKGGFGLIIIGDCPVHPTGTSKSTFLHTWDSRAIPGYRKIFDMVHPHGAKIFAELIHRGVHADDTHTRLPLWGPSPLPSIQTHHVAKEMEQEEIEEICDAHAKAAKNLQEAGVDGIDVHLGHGHLIHQFLSPLFNRRTDRYGGSLQNRMRFAIEIIDRVRETIDEDLALGVRISGDEFMNDGLTTNDMREISSRMEDTGKIDFIDVSVGNRYTSYMGTPPMYFPAAHEIPIVVEIKEVVDLPVFAAGRITDPVLAERILAEGKADMIAMTRASIADPELPNRAREGALDDIRLCIGAIE